MPNLGAIGSGATLGFTGGAVSSVNGGIAHAETNAIVSDDGFPQAPVAAAQVSGLIAPMDAISATVVQPDALTGEVG